MVILNFKLSELGRVEFFLDGVASWKSVLLRCHTKSPAPDSVIAIRRGLVLGPEDEIVEGDEIEVFPALSGG